MPEDKCILDPERDCIGKAAAAKLEARIDALEHWRSDSEDFHKRFYEWQRKQAERDGKLDEQLKNMDTNISKLVSWQESQQSAPKKRWDAIVDKIIWAVLAAVIAFVLAKVGL